MIESTLFGHAAPISALTAYRDWDYMASAGLVVTAALGVLVFRSERGHAAG